MPNFQCLSPIDGSVVYRGTLCTAKQIEAGIEKARLGQKIWREVALKERVSLLQKAVDHLFDRREEIGLEITRQMGRPIRYSSSELVSLKERGDYMLTVAPAALADIIPAKRDGFERWITREPLGTIAVLAPWNYPFLTAVNAIIPALVAGNSVILKHSEQTPMVALRYGEAFEAAGLPPGVFGHMFLDHVGAAALISHPSVDYVAFTGSVAGGHAVTQAVSGKFIGAGLELGGKDPAYVRADADISNAAKNLADGAFFNSGQSCCGIERIYADRTIFVELVDGIVAHANGLTLGDPAKADTTLGPMASSGGADQIRRQIRDSLAAGANAHLLIDENWGSAYLAPQVLTDVTHEMAVMTDESFGPVVGIMAVDSDEEAISLMNDSNYGLTASIWTKDMELAKRIGRQIETGTVFVNRCDYLDPALAWTGVKNSGRGCTLSVLGYEQLTRPKSYHFKEVRSC